MSKDKRSQWTETHFYDNNISESLIVAIQPLLDNSNTISREDKLIVYKNIKESLVGLDINNIGLKYYDQMIKSYMDGDNSNYDPINKLDALNLLYVIYYLSEDNDIILLLLKEQLEDMISGFCAQGRTIRFIQIISSFIKY